jgi:Flp pilus assembly protein TadG
MVEFVLVAPILLLLVFGIVQFGIMLNNYVTLTDAVRVGARQAAVSRTNPNRVTVTTDRVKSAAGNLDDDDVVVDVDSTWDQGGDVTVTATYPYSISLLGFVVKSGTLTSETTERVE